VRSIHLLALSAVIALGAAVSPAAGQSARQQDRLTPAVGTDSPGNDLGSVAVGRGDGTACEAICAANSQCNADTRQSPANESASYCWFKRTAGLTRPKTNSISGVRRADQPQGAAETAGPIPLSNGRGLYLPVSVAGCSRPVAEDLGGGYRITYDCASMGNALVEVLIALPPLDRTPRAVLEQHAIGWQPNFMSLPASQRAEVIRLENRELASGTAEFLCLTYDNVANLNGSSHCILEAPLAQLIIACDANMARDAYAAVTAVLRGMSIR